MKKVLLGLSEEELTKEILQIGEKAFRAKQISGWLKKGIGFSGMKNLPASLIEKLKENFSDGFAKIDIKRVSTDGTIKYLFKLEDGCFIESVLMHYEYGNTICISTQVGCAMACAFCSSGEGGLIRNLMPHEMLAQVLQVNADNGGGRSVTNIVLMGTGEPLANYENVMAFLHMVNDPESIGVGMRNISLSTCGIVPQIVRLAEEKLQITLCLSLHAATDEKRKKIMPISARFTVEETVSAMKSYSQKTGRRIIIEYILIKGFNMGKDDADELAKLFSGVKAHINLIPYNDGGKGLFSSPSQNEVYAFMKLLTDRKISSSVRRSLGRDIEGACGQLRSKRSRELTEEK